ncbi:MAG: hypothetical protein ABIQ31_11000 [Ferruginibacter sp.]
MATPNQVTPDPSIEIKTCSIKLLPKEKWIPAAANAVKINANNAPALSQLRQAAPEVVIRPEHLALLTSKYWGAGGVNLTVGFLDNPPADLRARILSHMNAWGVFSNVQFTETTVNPQVRISRSDPTGGYWSYLGTDVLSIPSNEPTMNLEGFSMNTPDAEFFRVVRHETGHTLGFPHEHMRSEIVDGIDREKAIAYFMRTQGWTREEVIAQVLTPIDGSALVATEHADPDSIMCYWLPAEIMKNGIAVPGGNDIDALDAQFAASVYRKNNNYQTRILEVATTFDSETDGVWLMADYDMDGIPDLNFIKTANTPENKVEVHIASGSSNYQSRILEVPTTFDCETDGSWLMTDYDNDGIPDLCFIKTANTPNNKVEVHIASGESNYQTRILEVATIFDCEDDGVWLMTDYDGDGIPDLCFIKTANTPNNKVEVHIASGESNYQTRILEVETAFDCETDGVWLMADYDMDGIPDLSFIKTANTPNNRVEVHIASGASDYQTRILEAPTTFDCENDGVWLMTDYDMDGIPDLGFIKTINTPNNKVEVHIAKSN